MQQEIFLISQGCPPVIPAVCRQCLRRFVAFVEDTSAV